MTNKTAILEELLDGLSVLESAILPPEDIAHSFAQWLRSVYSTLESAEMGDELKAWEAGLTGMRFSEDETLYACMRSTKAMLLGMLAKHRTEDLAQSTKDTLVDLRNHLTTIQNTDAVRFVEEAISCLENKLYRATVILSWVGAVSLLYDYVVQNRLSDFNAEATRRDNKWRPARNADDLARMKEYDFLEMLEALSIVGKNVKQELRNCLQLRNACGHPNSLAVSQNRTAAHLETLILNVFSKFPY